MNCNTNNMKICEAARFNNDGVSYLVRDDTPRAVWCFQQSLTIIKQEVVRVETTSNDNYDDVMQDYITKDDNNCKASSPIDTCPVPLKHLTSEGSFIYNRPLLFNQELIVQMQYNAEDVLSFASAVVLMNFALAYHTEGKKSKSTSMNKAGHLYQMSLDILEQTNESMEDVANMMSMLILNNQANIHYEIFNYEQTRICLHKACQILEDLEDCNEIDEEEADGIMFNYLLFKQPSAAGAA